MTQLYIADPTGAYVPAKDGQVIEAAKHAAARKLRRGLSFSSPRGAKDALIALLGTREAEVFCVAFLDNRHRLIEFVQMFQGTIDGASVYPREVIKAALLKNAAALVLVHNHPSGVCEQSRADEVITQRLKDACALIDVRILDHLIVAGDKILSFAEQGLL